MKLEQFKEQHNLKSDEDMRLFFERNLHSGDLPVAIAICPLCQEVLEDYSKPCSFCEEQREG